MTIDRNTGKLLDVDLGSEFAGVLTKEQLMKTLDQTFAHRRAARRRNGRPAGDHRQRPHHDAGGANGVDFSLKGTIEMSGVQYLDLKTGLQHSGESRSTFRFTQSMKEAQSGLTLDTEMEATSEISMVRK